MPAPRLLRNFVTASRASSGKLRTARVLALAILLLLFVGMYYFTASQLIRQTNQNRQKSDQQLNIDHTRLVRKHIHPSLATGFTDALWNWFPHYTNGVVNPLWPWIAARLTRDDESDQVLFTRGKWLNVSLTAIFCVVLGLVAVRFFSALATANIVLLVGFGALLPRSVYFQPESVYFMLLCLCWLCCLRIIHNNTAWAYALLGIIAGLAYLAKTSVQPLVVSFVLVTSYRFLQDAGTSMLRRNPARECSQWHWQRHFVGLVFFAVLFLLTAGPRLSYAHKQFGSAFHSYPSYWMWLDDFPEGAAFMQQYPNREALSKLDDEARPSLGNYLARHDAETARNRLTDGFWWTVKNFFAPKRAVDRDGKTSPWRVLLPARGLYLAALLAMLAGVFVWFIALRRKPEHGAQRLAPEASPAVLFALGGTLVYALAYGWYVPVGKGERFLLSVYAPLAITLVWAGESIMRRIESRTDSPWPWIAYRGAHLCLFLFISARLVQIYAHPYFSSK